MVKESGAVAPICPLNPKSAAVRLAMELFTNYCWFSIKIASATNMKFLAFYCQIKLNVPIALDRFNPPFTRPSPVIFPPAFVILAVSPSSSGLWSTDISTAFLPLHSTHLESPTFATTNWSPRFKATIAVEPLSLPT